MLVTGAAGFLGSFLVERLLKEGYNVVGIDNMFRGKKRNIAHLFDDKKFKFLQADVTREIPARVFENVEAVFHYAAINGTLNFYERPLDVLRVNVEGTINVLRQSDKVKKFVFASSSEVYGDPLYFPTDEGHPILLPQVDNPRHSYAASKAIGEYYVNWFSKKRGMNYLIFRIFNTYGPRMDTSTYGQVIPEFVRKILFEKEFTIIGAGTQTRSFCYIDDNIEMSMRAFHQLDDSTLNIGDDHEVSIIELAELMHKIVGKDFEYKLLSPRLGDPMRRVPDISKVVKQTGYKPQINLMAGLKKTIDYWRRVS